MTDDKKYQYEMDYVDMLGVLKVITVTGTTEKQVAVMDDYVPRKPKKYIGLVRSDNLDHFYENFTSNTEAVLETDVKRITDFLRENGMFDRSAGWGYKNDK